FTTAGTVMLVAWPGPDGITIEIRDTGPGLGPDVIIETEDLAAGRSGGEAPRHLGYGLRLAGRLVRVLGGSLTFATSRSRTTCLLRTPPPAVEEPVRSRPPACPTAPPPIPAWRVSHAARRAPAPERGARQAVCGRGPDQRGSARAARGADAPAGAS